MQSVNDCVRRKAISIGMNEHITKPIDAEKMKKTITEKYLMKMICGKNHTMF